MISKKNGENESFGSVVLRSTFSAVLTFIAGAILYMIFGPSIVGAILFAVACGVISIASTYVWFHELSADRRFVHEFEQFVAEAAAVRRRQKPAMIASLRGAASMLDMPPQPDVQ
jgi:Flp pilus assembly protein TadB